MYIYKRTVKSNGRHILHILDENLTIVLLTLAFEAALHLFFTHISLLDIQEGESFNLL